MYLIVCCAFFINTWIVLLNYFAIPGSMFLSLALDLRINKELVLKLSCPKIEVIDKNDFYFIMLHKIISIYHLFFVKISSVNGAHFI